jgi:hypothetical protein
LLPIVAVRVVLSVAVAMTAPPDSALGFLKDKQ